MILSSLGDVIPPNAAADLVGDVYSHAADWVVIPPERLGDDFFRLRTGVAGEFAQKFVNYRIGFIVLGDIARFTEASPTLRDFVSESNAGRQLWFVRDRAELDERLGRPAQA